MKKKFTLILSASIFLSSCLSEKGEIAIPKPPPSAGPVVVTIEVQNNVFAPSSAAATVGDTIKWNWASGVSFHTTTSVTIPAGANTWDSGIQQGPFTYTYIVTDTGTYSYECQLHAPGMVGTINVSQ